DETFAGVISGTGVTETAINVLTLTGNNTSAGTLLGAFTTLKIGAGGTQGYWTGDILLESSTVEFDRSDTITYGASVSDFSSTYKGSLTQAGAGALILTGASSY